MAEYFALFAWNLITIVVWMSGLWVIYLTTRNAGIVDIGWALGFALVMMVSSIVGHGHWIPITILSLLVYAWAFRLGFHLLIRYLTTEEDPRYTKIKENWGEDSRGFKMLGMFLFQGLLIVLLSIPIYIVCAAEPQPWHRVQTLALLVWLAGFAGETAADRQLDEFKRNPLHAGQVCDIGLWRYSRHPNYFFEWVIWISFALFASPFPGGLFAWISPIAMYFLLNYVSGIPLAEAQSLRSKEGAYKQYQQKTSAFVPWLPGK